MVKASKVIGTPDRSLTYKEADKVNREGFPAFSRSLEEQTLAVLLTNTLSNTFYVGAKELAQETLDVLIAMAKKDPEFLSKALVYARTEGLMKLAPTTGMVVLSQHDDPEKKVNFRRSFHKVVKTPDDLREFVALVRTGAIRAGLGGEALSAVKRWLQHMSTYHAIKYGSAASKDITLRDILRMSHPRPVDKAQDATFGWLVKGFDAVESNEALPAQIRALEKLKRSTDEDVIVELIEDNKFPWEVVVPAVGKMTTRIWTALVGAMPYMALLRNLNTMSRNGVLKDVNVAREIAERLALPANVAHSKQFPFRFYNAFNAFDGPQAVRDALVDALEVSFENAPELSGRVAISNDISGSMGCTVSDRGNTRYCDIAGLFGATLFKKSKDVILLPADDAVVNIKVSRRSTVMDIAKKIGLANGGTDLGAPIRHLIETKDKVDTYIGITDSEDWASGWYGRGFLSEWEDYKKKINPKAKAILVTISPYRDFVAPEKYPDVYFIHGWSDAVLKCIPMILNGTSEQVDVVKALDLSK